MRLAIMIMLVGVVIAACDGVGGPTEFNSDGSQGLTLSYLQGYPESEVYGGDPLPISLTIKNEGVVDIPSERLFLSFSYDPLYLSYAGGSSGSAVPIFLEGILPGRSPEYPSGGEVYVEEFNVRANNVVGQRESPETQLTAQVCYEYATRLAESVCLDVDSYLRSGREQACESQDLAPGTQGAPIAFSEVEVRTSPVGTGSDGRFARPEFRVTIRDVGSGSLVATPQADFESACRSQGVADEEKNAVLVSGNILNTPLECNPSIVRLRDGEGTTRCTVPEEHLDNPTLALQQNIRTVLELEARYLYRSAISKDITITRSDDASALSQGDGETPRVSGYAYESDGALARDSEGRPLTLCAYHAQGGGDVPSEMRGENQEDFSCSCGRSECIEMGRDGYCVSRLCPGQLECCDDQGFESFKNNETQGGSP